MKEGKIKRLRAFYASKRYILAVSALVLMGHTTLYVDDRMLFGGYQEFVFGGLMLLLAALGCYVSCDLRFLMMPFMAFILLIPLEHSPNVPYYSRFYTEPIPLTLTAILALVFLFSIGWFVFRHYGNRNPIAWRGKAFLGMAVFCGGLLFNGFFSRHYTFADTLYPISFLLSLLLVYVLFAAFVRFDAGTMEYFMTCLLSLGMIICAELLLGYLSGSIRLDESGAVVKESVMLGWGIWTAIGGMLAFLMPACFWFAHSHPRGWLYFGLGLLEYVCIILSQSRGALLFGTVVLALCLWVLVTSGKNRRENRILIGCLAVLGLALTVLLWDKLSAIFQNYLAYGFDDNGRYEKWRIGWNYFRGDPIFGAGFYAPFDYGGWLKDVYPYLYHNTPIQLLASCGLVGLTAYLYHRACTVSMVCKNRTPYKTFLGISILGLVSFSLLDVLFFNTYPTIIYSLMLLFMEKSDETEKGVKRNCV